MRPSRPTPGRTLASAFTLVEVLLSAALLLVITALLATTVDSTQELWSRSRNKVSQFQASRTAFDAMTRRISQATLNTYWRAQDADPTVNRLDYSFRRHAEFQFVSGPSIRFLSAAPAIHSLNQPLEDAYPGHAIFFHAPLGFSEELVTGRTNLRAFRGLDSLMNAVGYFVEYGDDPDVPGILAAASPPYPARFRHRLMELMVPAERFDIHARRTDDTRASDPRVFNELDAPYGGLVDAGRNPVALFTRPHWMKEALIREPASSDGRTGSRFRYARVLAENVVALIILPKLAERDRVRTGSGSNIVDPDFLELAPRMEFDSWRIIFGGDATDPTTGARIDNRVRDNALPPIVQVTMIAIDEPTAMRMNLTRDRSPKWWKDAFAGRIDSVKAYEAELDALLKRIREDVDFPAANFRVFTTDVVVRASKWSRDFKRS